MSLVNQLITAIFAVLIGLVSGTLYIMSDSSRAILENQLESHAQDSATHLGLYLAPYIAAEDSATIETAVNAIFDSGFYQQITVTNAEGNVLFEKKTPPLISDDVPEWFQQLIHITPPSMSRDITHQWRQAGKIHVQSRAGYAYEKLWRGAQDSILLFVSLSIVCLLAISSLVRYLLKPLKKVEDQAVALSEKRFVEQPKLPSTRELKYVVLAMNNMVHQVKNMFDEQARNIEELRHSAYQDSLTGLSNQRSSESQLAEKLDYRDDFGHGTLILVRLNNLQKINQLIGMDKTNTVLKLLATQLERISNQADQSVLGRLSGADFVLLTDQTDSEQLLISIEHLEAEVEKQLRQMNFEEINSPVINVGSCTFRDKNSSKQLLSQVRLAAEEASNEQALWKQYDQLQNTTSQPDASAWKEHIANAINQRQIFLQVQTVVGIDTDTPIHQEIFARILDRDGQPASAGEFINVVKELGLIVEMDKAIIELVLDRISQNSSPLTINLSREAISSEAFRLWLLNKIQNFPTPEKLLFEVDETGVLNHTEEVSEFRKELRELNIKFGVDHFGVHPSGFAYIYAVQPDYVKIDGSLVGMIEDNPEDKFFVSSLISVVHSLNIAAYAEHVERDTQRQLLATIEVDGTQGYLHGTPKQLEN
ncbi:bifunctional diguanylate cyclase/phosphodiesterase [Neptuniibacter sp.]|jgi:diguanylate cyclase (GGDEF)-like protein|uniref:bifunctional diguanylate cyclase/phosphodiesterase n=1 Tax=Neptuniibacter sp. TaxID=1962643 RepID=UPI003B59A08E